MRGILASLATMGWANLAGFAVVLVMQAGFVVHVVSGLRDNRRGSSADV